MAVPEARSSRLHGPGGRSRAVGAGYGTYHPPRHPRWSCAETGEAGRGAWEATEVAGLPETRNSVEFTGRVHSGLSAIRIATPARRLYARKRDTGLQRSELASARATEPTTPLDTLGGPLLNLTCAELTLLALLLPQPELLGGAREGLLGQAAQVLFAGVVRQLEDLGVHGPEHELAYVEVVAQVDAVLRVDARLRARPGLELSSLGL